MKIILLLISILSCNIWAGEIKITLDKANVYTGEIISGTVSGYQGPVIKEKMIQESVYILYLDDSRVDIAFLSPVSSNTLPLNDQDYLIWNPVYIEKIDQTNEVILSEQIFDLKNSSWLIALSFVIAALSISLWIYFKKIKPRLIEKEFRRGIKETLFAAEDTLDQINSVWKKKHHYLEVFPFIEEEFNKFEVTYFKYAFKPHISDEEKKTIITSYRNMLDQIRGGDFGI